MTGFRRLQQANVSGRRVLVRVDFNVPMQDGQVSDDTRLRRAKPSIDFLRNAGAKVILLSHFGRPNGKIIAEMSLQQIVPALQNVLGCDIAFAQDCVGELAQDAVENLSAGQVLLLENTRFHAGETRNDPNLAKQMAALGDIFVSDAFSVVHRAHVSTAGIAALLPAFAGLALERELDHLDQALGNPVAPVLAVVGGAKVSTKIDLLQNLVSKVDILCVGGGMANTFLFAQGKPVGTSLCEPGLAELARSILAKAKTTNCQILLPQDVVVAKKFAAHAPNTTRLANDVREDEMILDAGPMAVKTLTNAMDSAKTLIWNGPLGAFEMQPFDTATVAAAKYAANRSKQAKLISVAGGGDTVAALNLAEVADDFTFISTAGGAFLEWMEGKELPGIACLLEQNQ
ncbi:Phosphoglycerate kinase [hydrothermal vent metagenome]|uniref:phosphoglycerate kinase n=1 Tax=hydrothermal vent metagenome TaxID=652676 RepID=A0A3B0S1W1_9ZZZZ